MSKMVTLVAGAAGYVLGARAGRERYEQIKEQADRLMNNPRVQKAVSDAQDVVAEKAPVVKDKAASRVHKSGDGGSTGASDTPGAASKPAAGGSSAASTSKSNQPNA